MTAEPVPVAAMNLKAALAYIKAGLNPIPVKAGDKIPMLPKWQERTHATPDEVFDWFNSHPERNIGLICGMQPNGKYLWALDVDPKNNGDERLYELEQRYGPLPDTAWHGTPSGGKHFFFEGPVDYPYTNPTVMLGLDTRTHEGQVVAPPSQTAIGAYTHVLANAVHRAPWAPVPGYLLDLVEATKAAKRSSIERPTPTLSLGLGRWSAADWVRDHLDWSTYLLKHGWVHVRGELWRHPSATNEHSAALKNGGRGPLNGWSPNFPPSLMRLDRSRTDGTSSFSLFDFIAAYEHDGDTHRCGQWVWRTYGPGADSGQRAAPRVDSTEAGRTSAVGTTVPTWRLPQVPVEYWSANARNATVLQAARARRVGPDALDADMWVLQSLLIPPGWVLPPFVGDNQPLNMLACTVGKTGETKSTAVAVARRLLGDLPPWVVHWGMGSGEGIGATFLREETKEDGKGKRVKTGRLERNPDVLAALFEADEGSGLVQQAGRKGATVIANLCKAWSGSMLGEANADPSTRRLVKDLSYRIGALVNIQPVNFADLFSISNTGTGLTGRFLFAPASDYDIPDERPEWPDSLEFARLAHMPVELTADAEIERLIDAKMVAVHRNASLDGDGDATSHMNQVTLRIAGISAVLDERRHITIDDWAVASLRTEASAACLATLAEWSAAKLRDQRHRADVAKAESAEAQAEQADRIVLGKAVDRILTVLTAGPMAPSAVSAKLTEKQRPRRDEAWDVIVSMGKGALTEGRWALTP